jgi:hypothetical protein
LFLLLLAAGAVVVAVAVTRATDRAGAVSTARFFCPMHLEVTTSRPGKCPICRMPLEPVAAPAATPAIATVAGAASFDSLRKRIFVQGVRAPAWVASAHRVVALIHADQLTTLAVHERGRFAPSAAPQASVAVRLGDAPPAPWDEGTLRVEFELELEAGSAPLTAGDVGWVQMEPRPRSLPVVPASAIVQSPEGPYVLVLLPEHHDLARRAVQLSRFFGNFAVVLAGLQPGERVLVRDTFFFDAERRLRLAPGRETGP